MIQPWHQYDDPGSGIPAARLELAPGCSLTITCEPNGQIQKGLLSLDSDNGTFRKGFTRPLPENSSTEETEQWALQETVTHLVSLGGILNTALANVIKQDAACHAYETLNLDNMRLENISESSKALDLLMQDNGQALSCSMLTLQDKTCIRTEAKNRFLKKAATVIKSETGQDMVSIGTPIELLCQLGPAHAAGSHMVIRDIEVMSEDTFGQGWFRYKAASDMDTKPDALLYRYEFHVLANEQ